MNKKFDGKETAGDQSGGSHETRGEPSAEIVQAYLRGELSGAEEERVRDFLVSYPELGLAFIQPFPEDDAKPGEPGYVSDAELDRRWTMIEQQIDSRAAAVGGGRVLQFWRALAAVAATIAIISSVLAWQSRSEAKRLAQQLSAPRAGWEDALESDARRSPETPSQTLSAIGPEYVIAPRVMSEETFPRYRVEILDRETTPTRSLWSTVVPYEHGRTLVINVPRVFLPPGRYLMVVSGVDGDRARQLATYSLRVPGRREAD